MALTVLNNISSLTAENSLSNTQMNLQKTLTQLSTGMKINSGSDDAAGLSIANGMQANIAALTQSQQNANNGIGMLQTADGALSQVTTLLNRAVTLATEGANGNITTGSNSQAAALQTEFAAIKSEIDQIGTNTNFNGQNVFSNNAPASFSSTQGSTGTPLTAGTTMTSSSVTTINDSSTGGTLVFTGGSTQADLATAVANAVTAGTLSAGTTVSYAAGKLVIATTTAGASLNVSTNDAGIGPMVALAATNNSSVFVSDGTSTSATAINTAINVLSSTLLGLSATNVDLNSASDSSTALTAINAAVSTISAQRGVIGASVNRLQAASNVMANQVQNLTSASNSIENADIGKTVANMTQFNILQSTGMAALQQSNQAQQAVLKLLQ